MMKTSFILYWNKIGEDGNWSPWSGPGPCDKTCGGGVQVRNRTCTNPPPSGDGKKCEGPSTKTESCNTQTCKKIIPLLLYNNYRCHWSF